MTARQMGFGPEAVERVRLAGVLHDIGKIGIPDSVLNKPGPLTKDEWVLMHKHPEIAARILDGADLDDIREWVLSHHERPDGRGYPSGASDGDLSLEARIIAVADAFEAMTSDRIYRPAMSEHAARAELARHSGTQFDAGVVQSFLHVLEADDEQQADSLKAA
jgi:HD-GYP domain-containing protein (c-di-GMP phosphodiesterase class II)